MRGRPDTEGESRQLSPDVGTIDLCLHVPRVSRCTFRGMGETGARFSKLGAIVVRGVYRARRGDRHQRTRLYVNQAELGAKDMVLSSLDTVTLWGRKTLALLTWVLKATK